MLDGQLLKYWVGLTGLYENVTDLGIQAFEWYLYLLLACTPFDNLCQGRSADSRRLLARLAAQSLSQ